MSRRNLEISHQALACIELFADLAITDREKIAKQCKGFIYSKDEVIVSREDVDTSVYFILSGNVRITTYSSSGKEITFRDQHAGEFFGEMSAIDKAPRSAHVVAIDESLVALMAADQFMQLLNKYPLVMQKTFTRLTTLVRSLSERIIEFSTLGVRNRIHAELLRLANDTKVQGNKATITPTPTHSEIANRISTHREAVTRELRELIINGLLEKSKNCLTITDMNKLEKMVMEINQN